MIPAYTLAAEEESQEPRTWVSQRDDPISIIWKVFWYHVH